METIEIKTQDEFDKLPDSFEEYTKINITGNMKRINRQFQNCYIAVSGSAVIQYVYDSAVIQYVYDSAVIKSVSGSAVIKSVYGSAVIKSVSGSAVIKSVYGSAVIKSVYGSAVIKSVSDSAVIKSVSGSAVIQYVSGSAVIQYVYDSAVIKSVSDSAVIKSVSGSAVIQYVYGSAVIKLMYENAKVILRSNDCKVLKALQQSIIICEGCQPEVHSKSNIPIIYTQKAKHDIEAFFDIYGNETNTTILYKSVNPKTRCDFYTGKIKYEGIVKCNDFDNNPDRECGGGLHLSPLPQLALGYNDGLLLKCKVKKSDIVVYYDNISKVRCKKVKVIGECDIDGNLIKGDTK